MKVGNILVVDDEPHIGEMLKLRLEANDFAVACADSASEALKTLEKDPEIDVVMSDIMMPGMDGIELMRQIKEKYPDKEIILITGFASLETAIEAVRLGGFDYIKKPFENIPALLHTVKSAVDKKRIIAEKNRITEELKVSNEKLKRINMMLGDNVNELVMLHHITESISGTLSIEEVIDKFLNNIVEALDFRKAMLFLKDENQDILELKGSIGFGKKQPGSVVISLQDKAKDIIRALSEPEPLLLAGFKHEMGDELLQKVVEADTHSIIYFPLKVREEAGGVLVMESNKETYVRKLHSVKLYINQAALVISNARMFQRLCKINDELKEMDKLKSEFISTVSHELRTPLTTVKEGISIVLEGIVGEINERQERLLEISKKDVDRLSKLIEDLLNISRIEAGKIILERTRFALNAIIERVFSSLKTQSQEKLVELKDVCPGSLPFVYADQNRVIQVLVNLLANAIKFSSEKKVITVSAEVAGTGGFVEVNVKDDGIGIADEDQKKLFQKFSQIGREYGPGSRGTGLGLAISKELISMHGGQIWLKESNSGKGSTFSFTIPVYWPGIEEKAMLDDNIEAEIKKAKKIRGSFSLVAFKNTGKAQREELSSLRESVKKALTRGEDTIGLYNRELVLVLLKGAGKSSVGAWKDNVAKDLSKDLLMKFECVIVSYPEDGESREELLKKIAG